MARAYGPTNETLGKYIRELFGQIVPLASAIEDLAWQKPSCSNKPPA